MFDIYIKNFNQNGSVITKETLVQSVPAANEGELKLISPLPKSEMGKAESFEFSIESGTKYYDAFLQMKTYVRIVYDGDTIFYGRVLMIDNSGFRGTRKIRCEGPFSFLLDSPVEGVPEAQRSEKTVFEYMTQLIDSHNACVSSQDKKFRLGEVPGNYSQNISEEQKIVNTSRKYGSDGWTDTKSALEDLRSHYGGYYRVRYDDVNDENILDWMNHYFTSTVNDQTIEVGKNIVDINISTEIDNVFTVIVPIGKSTGTVTSNKSGTKSTGLYLNGYKTTDLSGNEFTFSSNFFNVPDITKFYTDAQLNSGYHKAEYYRNAIDKYGIIVKTVSFDDATTKEKLFNDAKEWIKNNYQGEVTKFTIKAVDMHQIGNKVSKISVGDQVNIVYPVGAEDGSFTNRSIVLTCLAINYDLYHPENNQYTFGIPANILTKTYGVSKQGKSINGGIPNTKPDPDPEPTPEEQALDRIWNWLQHHMIHYDGTKPYQEGFPGQRRGTYGTWLLESGGDYLFASTALRLVKCTRTRTSFDPKVDKAFIGPGGESCFPWGTQVEERWQEPVPTEIGETLTLNIIQKFNVFEYVLHEYGVDLWTLSGVKPDSIVTDEEGKITGFQLVEDEITHQKNYVKSMFYDPETRVMGFFGPNGQEVRAILDEDGNYRYWYETSPGSGEFKETNIRDLHIKAIDTEKKVGWIVEENGQGDLQFANPGEMTLAIEGHASGELVVSRVAGELMYLGNTKTQRIMTTSVEHMDQVTGDVEYVSDETDPSLKVFKINSGGGFRVNHGKKVLKNGPDGKPLDPTKPENWEYETIIDPVTGEKKIVTADFGVYDNNNLVGGILSEKLNDGTVKTLIRGDVVDIDASQIHLGDTSNVQAWITQMGGDFDTLEGTVTDHFYAYDAHFNTLDTTTGTIKSTVTDHGSRINTIEGSALWTNRNSITGVVGEFDVVTDTAGVKHLVVKSGGGLRIRRNSTEFGVYDSGNLTGGAIVGKINGTSQTDKILGNKLDPQATDFAAWGVYTDKTLDGGVLVQKINDGSTSTQILGSRVDIQANQIKVGSTSNVQAWMNTMGDDFDNLEGTVTDHFTAYDAHFNTLDTTTGSLKTITTEHGSKIQTIEGSALWTRRNDITGVVGEFDIKTDATGKKYLVIKSGGGLRILQNSTEFGVYHNGNLTGGAIVGKINGNGQTDKILGNKLDPQATDFAAWGVYTDTTLDGGVLVQKINDGSTTTQILGTRVNIDANQVKIGSTSNVQAWMNSSDTWKESTDETLEDYAGLIADRATIAQLNAQKARIDTIESDYISANNIESKIGNISILHVRALTTDYGSVGNVYGPVNCGTLNAKANVIANGDIYFATGSGSYYQTYSVKSGVSNVRIKQNGNSYTLQKISYGKSESTESNWQDVGSFSRATSLSGAWSGTGGHTNTFTVTASPQGNTISEVIGSTFGAAMGEYYIAAAHYSGTNWTSISNTSWTYKLGLSGTTVQVQNQSGVQYSNTPTYTIPLQSKSVSANGTVTPDSGYVGLLSVTVSVPSSTAVDRIDIPSSAIQVSTSKPDHVPNDFQPLTQLPNAIKNNRNTTIWFRVDALDSNGRVLKSKWYSASSA